MIIDDLIAINASNSVLNATGRAHGIHTLLERCHKPYRPLSQIDMATTVEAIVGAVHMDKGPDHVPRVLQRLGIMSRFGDDRRASLGKDLPPVSSKPTVDSYGLNLKAPDQAQSFAGIYLSNRKLRVSSRELQKILIKGRRKNAVPTALQSFASLTGSVINLRRTSRSRLDNGKDVMTHTITNFITSARKTSDLIAKTLKSSTVASLTSLDCALRRVSQTARLINGIVLNLATHGLFVPRAQSAGKIIRETSLIREISHDSSVQTAIAMHLTVEKLSKSVDDTQRLALQGSIVGDLALNLQDSSYPLKALVNLLQPRRIVMLKNVSLKSQVLVEKVLESSHEIERMVFDVQD